MNTKQNIIVYFLAYLTETPYSAGNTPSTVVVSDFNNDNKLDFRALLDGATGNVLFNETLNFQKGQATTVELHTQAVPQSADIEFIIPGSIWS